MDTTLKVTIKKDTTNTVEIGKALIRKVIMLQASTKTGMTDQDLIEMAGIKTGLIEVE